MTLNRTAAAIAAAALFEVFPGIELLESKRISVGFSCAFRAQMPIPADAELLLEERMRQIVREHRPIHILEMVPFSAKELLLKDGHIALAEVAGEAEDLVDVVQIGSFYDLCPGPHLTNSSQLPAFKLWPIQRIENQIFRLRGYAAASKEDLNAFLKLYKAYPEKSHIRLGEKKSFWRLWNDQVVWLTAGLREQRTLIQILRENLFVDALEVRFSTDNTEEARNRLHFKFVKGLSLDAVILAEVYREPLEVWDPEVGLFDLKGGGVVFISVFVSMGERRKKLSSLLQMIGKTLNILGFQHSLCLFGRRRSAKGVQLFMESLGQTVECVETKCEKETALRLNFLVDDRLRRRWAAFTVELSAKGFFITASVERLIALLLERTCFERKMNGER